MQLSLRIDPDCVAQAEREWMNGFSLLTRPDLCNCVWPRAFLHLHRTFVNKHNLYMPYHTECPGAILLSNTYSTFFTLVWLPCFKSLQSTQHFHILPSVVYPVSFNCIFYSAFFYVLPQHSASTALCLQW